MQAGLRVSGLGENCHWPWEKLSLALGKIVIGLGENCHWRWGKLHLYWPWGEIVSLALGENCVTGLGKIVMGLDECIIDRSVARKQFWGLQFLGYHLTWSQSMGSVSVFALKNFQQFISGFEPVNPPNTPMVIDVAEKLCH